MYNNHPVKTRWVLLAASIMSFFASSAIGQTGNGYVVAGAGSLDSKLVSHAAVGGEIIFGKGIGAGVEIGAIAGHSSFGEFSLNGYYQLVNPDKDRKLDPFITGGLTLGLTVALFGSNSTTTMGNVGAGLNYWFSRHLGLRAEFRDLVNSGGQAPLFRGGISFR